VYRHHLRDFLVGGDIGASLRLRRSCETYCGHYESIFFSVMEAFFYAIYK
jgi:hypothetical protein